MNSDFVIVGGGIGGGVLAALLAKAGKRVVVLERAIAPPTWTRPEILWPATVETLFSLLPRSTWEEDALLHLGGIDTWNGRETIHLISAATLEKIQVARWAADAVRLRERLLGLGTFEVHRGIEVTAVLKEQNRIMGVRTRDIVTGLEREFLATWTVGDDGVQSVVRQACGLEIHTKMFPLDFLCFAFSWPGGFHPTTARVWPNFEESRAGILGLFAVPLPLRGAGVILVRPGIFEAKNDGRNAWDRFCAFDPALKDVIQERRFPDDFVRIRRQWGHSKRYGIEGAILLGDAAHPVSPAGGQGANMSAADARVLAEIAVSNPFHLLEEYELRRHEANERSLRFTRGAARMLGLPARVLPIGFVISLIRWTGQHPSIVAPIIRYVSTAFQERTKR